MTPATRYWLIFAVAFLVGKYGMRLVLRRTTLRQSLNRMGWRVQRWWHGRGRVCAWCGGFDGWRTGENWLTLLSRYQVESDLRVCLDCRRVAHWNTIRQSIDERLAGARFAAAAVKRLDDERKPKSLFSTPEGGTITIHGNAKPLYKR